MNYQVKKIIAPILTISLLATASIVMAQQAPKPEKLIKIRQSSFQVIAWNSSRIKASLEGQYNKEEVIKSANAIAAIANSGLGALFSAGTEQGKGWHETEAKPELFKNLQRFAELGTNFSKEASELATVAAGDDAAAVKVQYGKLTRTCKACHDDFKSKD